MTGGNAQGTAGTLTFAVTELYDKSSKALTPPTQSFVIPHPTSWDTLRQGGVFAPDDTLKGYLFSIDGDIKNQVSSALNRNVMHGEYSGDFDAHTKSKGTIRWADRSAFYQVNNVPAAALCINDYGKFLHAISIDNLCYALAYDDKYGRNVNLSANLDPDSPTVMKLMVYDKKVASAGGSMPAASATAVDFLGEKYTISVEPDPDHSDQVTISISSQSGKTLTNCSLMYARVPADSDSYNSYFPGSTTDNAVTVTPASYAGGFHFVFRFEISGDSVAGRQYLLPSNASVPKGSVYVYDPSDTKTPLSTVTIANA